MNTVGYLIVIGIVLVILAVYRQLDRNNRSLEKVKRYADKVQGDLDGIVSQKAMELRDMSIEVDVHQKAAREVLKRIQGIEESLNTRAEQIEQIGSRINDYDGALDELVQMTRRVEENISRIRDESDYVDKVGKRLTVSSQRMTELEQSINGLIIRFEEMNRENVERMQEGVIAQVQTRIDELSMQASQAEKQVGETVGELHEQGEEVSRRLLHRVQSVEEKLAASVSSYTERVQGLEKEYARRLDEAAERGERLETAAIQKLREHIETKVKAASQELTSQITELRSTTEAFRSEVAERVHSADEELSGAEGQIADRIRELDRTLAELEKNATKQFSTVQTQTRELAQAMERDLLAELKSRMGETADSLRKHVAEAQQQFETESATVAALNEKWREKQKELGRTIDTTSQTLADRVEQFSTDFTHRLETRSEEVEQSVVSRVEKRLDDYEKGLGYRFEKIEAVQTDIDALEANLRESMERMTARMREEVTQLGTQLSDRRKADIEEHNTEMGRLRGLMAEIEKSIDELKARAYDNVSEKLRVFEDEFFSDLRDRNVNMQQRLADWQAQVQTTLDSMGKEGEDERSRIEAAFTEELQTTLADIQSRFTAQYERIERQASEFRTRVEAQLSETDTFARELSERLAAEIAQAEESGRERLQSRFAEMGTEVEARLSGLDRTITSRMKSLEETVEIGHRDMEAVLEAAKSDVTVWQSQVLQQLKASEAEVDGEFAGFRVQVSDTISSIRDNFEQQKEELLAATNAERAELRDEIDVLATRVRELESDLESRTQTILDTLAGEYQQFQSEFQKKSRDIQSEADTKMREFRTFVHDTREQFDLMQQKLLGKLDEDVNVLNVNLAEIDKRQKSFIDQTKIFERADTLKSALFASIEEMKREIGSVETRRKELAGIESEFGRLRKLGDEATERLTRFMAEKRRIDSIEEDYKRLIGMSQAVELKLEQVTASNDTLTQMQLSLRNLDDMQKDVESKFQRLEKKRSILDVTAEGVDKNFQYLEELEQKLDTVRSQLDTLPPEVEELFDRLEQLSLQRKDVDSAVKQLNGLDELMSDVEKRMEELQTAREWLARTETRLEEISRSAEEQVKLLGSLMKDEAKGSKERGAPSLSARDTVIKLARQGWKVQEIAQATKLSRGEVELILEIAHK
ncbi:SpiroCoCo family coiled-coil protein [Salinispira pacifica]